MTYAVDLLSWLLRKELHMAWGIAGRVGDGWMWTQDRAGIPSILRADQKWARPNSITT
jgi:hypothetical protein